jgi:hypothetical protein
MDSDLSADYAPSIFKVEESRFANRDGTRKMVIRPKESEQKAKPVRDKEDLSASSS